LAGEQQLVPPETEVTREVQEVARQSDKMGVGVVVDAEAEAAVVEVLDNVGVAVDVEAEAAAVEVFDIVEWVHEKLPYGSLLAERPA